MNPIDQIKAKQRFFRRPKRTLFWILAAILNLCVSYTTAFADAILNCDGLSNSFRRPAPAIELNETSQGYLLTMTDKVNQVAASFIIPKKRISLAPISSSHQKVGFLLEVKGHESFSPDVLSIRVPDLPLPTYGQVPANSQRHELLIRSGYVPSSLHWASLYHGGTCRWNLNAVSNLVKSSLNTSSVTNE
jgi:hypothetical protein